MAWSTLRDEGGFAVEKETSSALGEEGDRLRRADQHPQSEAHDLLLAFLPQFVGPDEPQALLRMVGLSAVFMLLTLVVFVGYGQFAAAIRDRVLSRPRVLTWMRRVFAGAFGALGARLAFAER